jgi:hypothetical protein
MAMSNMIEERLTDWTPIRRTRDAQRAASPDEVFPTWDRAQLEVERLAREAVLAPYEMRTTGFLRPDVAERVTDWFTGNPTAPADAVRRSYRALERETARLFEIVCGAPSFGGLGVRVRHVRTESDPYSDAAELSADLREHRSMMLRTIACDEPHPLLGGEEGGVVDQLRVVHDVFGHAALGVGFDLQSEFATWLQCRTLFSHDARSAAFCELVGAVTTYITTGEKPALRADLPPTELVAACDVDAVCAVISRRSSDSGDTQPGLRLGSSQTRSARHAPQAWSTEFRGTHGQR